MRKFLFIIIATLAGGMNLSASNRLSASMASMDAPEGYVYNKTISGNTAMEVYTAPDASGAISFGVQDAQDAVTPSALATVLANTLIKDGVHSGMTSDDGTPIHLVTSGDNKTALAIAGDRNARRYTIIIFTNSAAANAQHYLKTLKLK